MLVCCASRRLLIAPVDASAIPPQLRSIDRFDPIHIESNNSPRCWAGGSPPPPLTWFGSAMVVGDGRMGRGQPTWEITMMMLGTHSFCFFFHTIHPLPLSRLRPTDPIPAANPKATATGAWIHHRMESID